MEIFVNLPQELGKLSLPPGISLRCGNSQTLPDYLVGRGYREFNTTNETLSGIAARAEKLRESNVICAFAGVGTATKVVLQAALLEPREYLGFVDISGQNVFDATLLASALRSGYPSILAFLDTNEGRQHWEALSELMPDRLVFGFKLPDGIVHSIQSERIQKTTEDLGRVDNDLVEGQRRLGISTADCIRVLQQAKEVEISLDSIRSEVVLNAVIRDKGRLGIVVIDSSNVPLYGSQLYSSKIDPLIFFGFNGTNDDARELGVPDFGYKRSKFGIHYWSFPLNDDRVRTAGLFGGMTVGMGYFQRQYNHIIDKVDGQTPQW